MTTNINKLLKNLAENASALMETVSRTRVQTLSEEITYAMFDAQEAYDELSESVQESSHGELIRNLIKRLESAYHEIVTAQDALDSVFADLNAASELFDGVVTKSATKQRRNRSY